MTYDILLSFFILFIYKKKLLIKIKIFKNIYYQYNFKKAKYKIIHIRKSK